MTADTIPTEALPRARATTKERVKPATRGAQALTTIIVVALLDVGLYVLGVILSNRSGGEPAGGILIGVAFLVTIADSFAFRGLTPVVPGEARVVQIFGRYMGTIRRPGLCWVNPFTERRKVSTRIRNYETQVAKVNDADGNPIEIAAVVVWQVKDTALGLYAVDDFVQFVATQTETAVRHIATSYPYDTSDAGQLSLRGNADEITERLSAEIAARVAPAGVTMRTTLLAVSAMYMLPLESKITVSGPLISALTAVSAVVPQLVPQESPE